MKRHGFASARDFWLHFGWGTLSGLVGAIAIGEIIALLLLWIPVNLAVGCVMAAIPAALIPVPLALAIITALITSITAQNLIPVAAAALTAYFVLNGLILPDPAASQAPAKEGTSHA